MWRSDRLGLVSDRAEAASATSVGSLVLSLPEVTEEDRRVADAAVAELTQAWTADVWFLARSKGFDIDRELAHAVAAGIAKSIVRSRQEDLRLAEERVHRREIQGRICASVSLGYSKISAAERAGISRETLRLWSRDDPGFREILAEADRRGRPLRREIDRRRLPRKMTDGVRAALTTLLAEGKTRSEALAAVGVSRQTFHTWLNRQPEFRDAILRAEGRRTSRVTA